MAEDSRPLALICGSGASILLPDMEHEESVNVTTPYGETSAPISICKLHGLTVCVLNRHGEGHTIPPHRINYRSNIWALAELGCKSAIGLATVGGIRDDLKSGNLMLPTQIIDYTWGRESTFFDGGSDSIVGHLENANPYCNALRDLILLAAEGSDIPLHDGGTYAATQGPRFETAAEIDRIERDGGDVVGMTGMPETTLAAEKQICYASINLIVNPAAGRGEKEITTNEMREAGESGCENLKMLINKSILELANCGTRSLPLNSHIMKM